jgi:hypothetical protein
MWPKENLYFSHCNKFTLICGCTFVLNSSVLQYKNVIQSWRLNETYNRRPRLGFPAPTHCNPFNSKLDKNYETDGWVEVKAVLQIANDYRKEA